MAWCSFWSKRLHSLRSSLSYCQRQAKYNYASARWLQRSIILWWKWSESLWIWGRELIWFCCWWIFEAFHQNFFITVFPPQGLNLNTPPWKEFSDRRGVAKTNKCKSQKHKRRDHLGNCKRRPHRENKRKHKEKRKQTMNKSKGKGKARSGRVLGSSTSSLPPNKLNRSNILICPTEKKDSHSVFPGCALWRKLASLAGIVVEWLFSQVLGSWIIVFN